MRKLDRRFYTMCPHRRPRRAPRSEPRAVRRPGGLRLAACACVFLCSVVVLGRSLAVTVLRPIEALPPHIAGLFRNPAGFEQLASGAYLVFDRGGHAVYRVDAARTTATEVVRVGQEEGRLLQPVAFDVASDGSFAVADAPFGRERVQLFAESGARLGGFALPGRVEPRLQYGGVVLNGVGSLTYDGEHVYVNQPETGALITAYSLRGWADRTIGTLRPTGYESTDRDVHLALNVGIPVLDPRGGFYFVFQSGEPRFRKYDAKGVLLFERAIQGKEIDPLRASQPTTWPARTQGTRELPVVPPIVRTAAVDPAGNLWVSMIVPWTYVYEPDGDKVRVVQFATTGMMTPASFTFGTNGRLLVTPGCYVFDWKAGADERVDDGAPATRKTEHRTTN